MNVTWPFVWSMRRCKKGLIDKKECDAVMKQILWNAVVLVQGLWFIENGERFSPKDCRVKGNSVDGLNHSIGFTSFGVDDFMSDDNRVTSKFKWFEENCQTDDANMFFPNVGGISRLMNERYNELRKKFPQLSIERHMVTSIEEKIKLLSVVCRLSSVVCRLSSGCT